MINANEPAMPVIEPAKPIGVYYGFSKRELFAKDALAAILQNPGSMNVGVNDAARFAVLAADALIAELNKTSKP